MVHRNWPKKRGHITLLAWYRLACETIQEFSGWEPKINDSQNWALIQGNWAEEERTLEINRALLSFSNSLQPIVISRVVHLSKDTDLGTAQNDSKNQENGNCREVSIDKGSRNATTTGKPRHNSSNELKSPKLKLNWIHIKKSRKIAFMS